MTPHVFFENQVDMCNKCQYHVGWTKGGWCYMFQEMQTDCQKFLTFTTKKTMFDRVRELEQEPDVIFDGRL